MKKLILITLLTISSFAYSQSQDSYYFNRKITLSENVEEDHFLTTPNDLEGNYTIRVSDGLNNTILQYIVVEYSNTPDGGLKFSLRDSYGNDYIMGLSPRFDKMAIMKVSTKEVVVFIREITNINRI